MANNCLVTKLKDVIHNDNLPKINETLIHINAGSSFVLGIESLQPQTLEIKGNGTFTSTGTKTCSITASQVSHYDLPESAKIGMSAGEYILSIPDKRYICTLQVGLNNDNTDIEYPISDIMYLPELYYSSFYGATGTCFEVKKMVESCPKIKQIFYIGQNLSGDINDLGGLTVIFRNLLPQYSAVTGIYPSSGIRVVEYYNSKNISATTTNIAKSDKLMVIAGHNQQLTGDINAFHNQPNITKIILGYATNVYGDLSTIPSSCFQFIAPPNVSFTWTENGRASGARFLGIGDDGNISKAVELGNDIDNMLKNQTTATTQYAYWKIINVTGTSNYATDSTVQNAIRTIRDNFGVKIIINGIEITSSVVPAS